MKNNSRFHIHEKSAKLKTLDIVVGRVLCDGMWVMMMEAGSHGIVCCVCLCVLWGVKCKCVKWGVGIRYSVEENVYLGVNNLV